MASRPVLIQCSWASGLDTRMDQGDQRAGDGADGLCDANRRLRGVRILRISFLNDFTIRAAGSIGT